MAVNQYFSRREVNALLFSGLLASCQISDPLTPLSLKAWDRDLLPDIGAGYIIVRNGKIISQAHRGLAAGLAAGEKVRRPFQTETAFRAASVSKIVPVLIAHKLARKGQLDLDGDVSKTLGFQLRNPSFVETPITLRNLLAHTSTLRDPDIYWMAAPGDIRELLTSDIYRKDAGGGPGKFFEYCNLNYGLVATALERITRTRFDLLASDYLNDLGLDAGFNWSGVSLKKRRHGATLYRQNTHKNWIVQTDGADILSDNRPYYLGWNEDDLSTYHPGTNGTLFSPQGGLRASLEDLLGVAEAITKMHELHDVTWTYNAATQNGQSEDGHFLHYGDGLYIYPETSSPLPGRKMVGHHGEAYGLYSGLWILPEENTHFVYAITGSPDGVPPSSGKRPNNRSYVQAFLDHIGAEIKAL